MSRRKKDKASDSCLLLFILGLGGIIISTELLPIVIIGFIVFYFFRWKQISNQRRKILQSNIREIDIMNGIEFERFMAATFETMGYEVNMTSVSGDFGADLILKKDNRTIVVQAKRHNQSIGISAVQQVHAAISYYKADEAWVVTNQDYSKAAYELAQKSNIRLINRNQLIEIIVKNQEA